MKWLVEVARDHNLAIRIGVNCGSVAPAFLEKYPGDQLKRDRRVGGVPLRADGRVRASTASWCRSRIPIRPRCWTPTGASPQRRPDVPLHLGVTEAGLPPDGIIKTRIAFEKLLAQRIGDTIRVSLTLPNERKHEEVDGRPSDYRRTSRRAASSRCRTSAQGLNIISCPSCSRVENEKFVELAQQVKELTAYASRHQITIAVMGCRVNGPGETDDADLGLWCGPTTVNLKKKDRKLGNFSYDEVLTRLRTEVDKLIAERSAAANN